MGTTRDLSKIAESPGTASFIVQKLDTISSMILKSFENKDGDISDDANFARSNFFKIQEDLYEWVKIVQWLQTSDAGLEEIHWRLKVFFWPPIGRQKNFLFLIKF